MTNLLSQTLMWALRIKGNRAMNSDQERVAGKLVEKVAALSAL
jgi:hypothetical protein